MTPERTIDATNPHRVDAENHAAQARTHLDPLAVEQNPTAAAAAAAIAAAEATLALAYETRTAALVHYLATLPLNDRHEAPAVLELVKARLGLTSPEPTPVAGNAARFTE